MERQIWHQHYDPEVPISLDYPPIRLIIFCAKPPKNIPIMCPYFWRVGASS